MGGKIIGDASEFYRLRIVRVDDAGTPELQWRDDILYRQPPVQAVEEFAVYRVEVMDSATEEVVNSLGEYETADEAETILDEIQESLDSLTKKAFDARYVDPA